MVVLTQHKTGGRMTHSQMVQTRRRKQAGKKQLARAAKQAKKLSNQNELGVASGTAETGTVIDSPPS
jgi:hypothetical protein